MKRVRLLKAWKVYRAGVVLDVNEAIAESLVRDGFAEIASEGGKARAVATKIARPKSANAG